MTPRTRKRPARRRKTNSHAAGHFPAPPGLSYMPHQVEGIEFLMQHQNAFIADDIGLEKQTQVFGLINADPSIGAVLVICPAYEVERWEREAQKWLVRPTLAQRIASKSDPVNPHAKLVLCASEKLIANNRSGVSDVYNELAARRWGLIVVGSAESYRGIGTKQARAIFGDGDNLGLIHRAQRRVFVGSPVMIGSNAVDLWNIVHALAPREFPDFNAFGRRYGFENKGRFGSKYVGARNLDELYGIMRGLFLLKRTRSDVMRRLEGE